MNTDNPAEYHLEQAARYFDDTDDFDKALAECDAALKIDPTLAEAHNLRGMILEELGEPLKAIAAYKDALVIDPELAEAQENLSALREELAAHSGLVTIAAFSHPLEAHIVRGRLETEGIESFITDENMVTNWLFSTALGGVRIQVREDDAERARGILADGPEEIEWEADEDEEVEVEVEVDDGEEEPERCPRCASTRIHYEKFAKRPLFLSWLLLGFPLPFLKGEWVCQNCGYSWKAQ